MPFAIIGAPVAGLFNQNSFCFSIGRHSRRRRPEFVFIFKNFFSDPPGQKIPFSLEDRRSPFVWVTIILYPQSNCVHVCVCVLKSVVFCIVCVTLFF